MGVGATALTLAAGAEPAVVDLEAALSKATSRFLHSKACKSRRRVRRHSAEVALVSARLRGTRGGGVSPPDLPFSGSSGVRRGSETPACMRGFIARGLGALSCRVRIEAPCVERSTRRP